MVKTVKELPKQARHIIHFGQQLNKVLWSRRQELEQLQRGEKHSEDEILSWLSSIFARTCSDLYAGFSLSLLDFIKTLLPQDIKDYSNWPTEGELDCLRVIDRLIEVRLDELPTPDEGVIVISLDPIHVWLEEKKDVYTDILRDYRGVELDDLLYPPQAEAA